MACPIRILFFSAALLVGSACDSGGSPLLRNVGQASISAQVGPGGATLRGDGSSSLGKLVLDIPPGAVDRLVRLTIEIGPDIAAGGSTPLGSGIRMIVTPEVGPLAKPALLTLAVDLPLHGIIDELVVFSKPAAGTPSSLEGPEDRIGVAADHGVYDLDLKLFTFQIQALEDMQVRLVPGRHTEDALDLVSLGYDALLRMTDSSLLAADRLFSEAQQADPYLPAANLLRAISRVLVLFNSREDTGPGLDSVGEALTRLGIDTRNRSLLARARSGVWPSKITVPAGAPLASEVSAMLRGRVRPGIELALRDLDRVPLDTLIVLRLPSILSSLPGDRELDAADIVFLRAALSGLLFGFDWLEDQNFDADSSALSSRAAEAKSLADRLTQSPSVGHLRSLPEARTMAALEEFLFSVNGAFGLLKGEDDPQDNDLVVMASSMTFDRQDLWRGNLTALYESLRTGELRRLVFEGFGGTQRIDLRGPLSSGAVDLRDLFPGLFRFLPLARALPDSRFAGLLPDLTPDDAVDLFGLFDQLDLPEALIVVDGRVGDWPAQAEALTPEDPIGDLALTSLQGIDLTRAFLATSGDNLVMRLSVANAEVRIRNEQPTVYGLRMREVGVHGFGASIDVVVLLANGITEVRVSRDGVGRTVRSSVAFVGSEIEVALNRFDLLDPDEPEKDRVVDFYTEGLDLRTAVEDGDKTRGALIRF